MVVVGVFSIFFFLVERLKEQADSVNSLHTGRKILQEFPARPAVVAIC